MSPCIDSITPNTAIPGQADVVVIGGGIIGVATAWFLARRGVSVVLCEKGRIAAEQSSRNWGWVRQQGRDPREVPLIMESLRVWETLEKDIAADVGFKKTGLLYLADSEAEVADFEQWLADVREFPLDSRIISGTELDAVFPGQSRLSKAALYTPSDGRAEPFVAAPAIARAAQAAGAIILTNCAVRGIEKAAGRVAAVVTEKGRIRSSRAVLAGGAWSTLFCRSLGIRLPQLSTRASVLRTERLPSLTECPTYGHGFALRRRQDGGYTVVQGMGTVTDVVPDSVRFFRDFWPALRLQLSSVKLDFGKRFLTELLTPARWNLNEASPFEKHRVLDPPPCDRMLDEAMATLKATYAPFKDAVEIERWAGLIDVTPDLVPVISETEGLPGLVIATGFSGHGFGIGPGAGKLIADIVMGSAPVVDPRPFRLSRFSDGTSIEPYGVI